MPHGAEGASGGSIGLRETLGGSGGGGSRGSLHSGREARPLVPVSTRWVCGAFIQTLGSLDSGVNEGVTNQSLEMGINYANNHLAMGQMTSIL